MINWKFVQTNWLKIFGLHLLIVLVYITATCVSFVLQDEHNPIGVGIMQWLSIIVHFLITRYVCVSRNFRKMNKENKGSRLLVNLLAIIVWVTVYFLTSYPIWDFLWRLRGA